MWVCMLHNTHGMYQIHIGIKKIAEHMMKKAQKYVMQTRGTWKCIHTYITYIHMN